MLKKDKTLHYLLVNDMLLLLIYIVLIPSIYWIVIAVIGDPMRMPIHVIYMEAFVMVVIVYGVCPLQSFMQHDKYITFGFCRRRFYQEQVVLCGVRAILLSVVGSVMQFMNYDNFVAFFIEDTEETAQMYHRVPFVELFLARVIFYFLVYMVFLLLSIHTVDFGLSLKSAIGASPHLKQRRQMRKEQNRVFWICRNIILKIAVLSGTSVAMVGNTLYQRQMMTRPFSFRLECMAVMVTAGVILYFVGRKRFSPKYI